MDLVQIGSFLAQLRKERGLTQEQLGQQLGVTNKTISRWETGTYLPPAEMLLALSEQYSITINELLSAKRLAAEEYQQEAEKNILEISRHSAFSLKEGIDFFTGKWKKEHVFESVVVFLMLLALIAAGFILDNGLQLVGIIGCVIWTLVQRNRMLAYVERHAYGHNSTDD